MLPAISGGAPLPFLTQSAFQGQIFMQSKQKGITMTSSILHQYTILVDFLGKALGPDYEIVLHDITAEPSRIIAIANQKGGVGKTTTAINLSASLAEKGRKVLAIDMDPQGNMSSGLGLDKNAIDGTIYDMIIGEADVEEVIHKDTIENLDILPSNVDLSAVEIEMIDVENKEFVVKNAIQKIRDNYDYVIIDCPPSLSLLTVNAMTTADSVLVPIQCEYYALEGLSQLIHTVELVKDRLNPVLEIEGVVFTMYDARTNLSLQVVENVKDNLEQNIYKTIIPRNIRLAEAPSFGTPINQYDPRSAGAESYMRLAEEVISKES